MSGQCIFSVKKPSTADHRRSRNIKKYHFVAACEIACSLSASAVANCGRSSVSCSIIIQPAAKDLEVADNKPLTLSDMTEQAKFTFGMTLTSMNQQLVFLLSNPSQDFRSKHQHRASIENNSSTALGDFSLLWRNWCPHYQKDHGKYRMRGECSSARPQILPWSCNVEWSCSEPIEDAVFITTCSTVPRPSQLLILSLSCYFAASHAIDMISRSAESPSDRAVKIEIYKAALSPTIE